MSIHHEYLNRTFTAQRQHYDTEHKSTKSENSQGYTEHHSITPKLKLMNIQIKQCTSECSDLVKNANKTTALVK